ncbi:hypothetical protein DXG03_001045 [Asterophora parasitica]|uniref:Uncharacterized protein n=1 Tax=Asterophora parasitica TaxID=117018 RepID=A0A9P7GAB0_9AGAR|nr:hypothetical protein DXG03_001045 [Asterophora parasitica]
MSSAQVLNVPTATPAYAFLSKPPQKKRPTYPPPATPRTAAHSAIASWAALVQPGSPGSPHSLRRRSSLSRRPSVSSRRTPTPSRSFFLVETPPAANKDFAVDLTDLGYTSVFVHLPKTPSTPAQFAMKTSSGVPVNPNSFPVPPSPARAAPLKRLRSFSILRSRNRSASTSHAPVSPTKSSSHRTPKPRSPTTHESPQIIAASIAQRKKAVYAHAKQQKPKLAASKPQLPPSLAAEIALMQFADGGSTEANIKRLMQAHARAAAPAGTKPGEAAVGDVYRDGKGGVWWDREEEMEYVHLLGGHTSETRVAGPGRWVSFGGEVKDGKDVEDDGENAALALASLADDGNGIGRRDSATSTASATSSLDPCNVVKPAEEDAAILRVPRIPLAPIAPLNISPKAEQPTKDPKRRPTPEPLLTVPSRPRTTHHHLRATPNFFLLDLNAFSVPVTPRTPHTPRTPRTPASPYPLPATTSSRGHAHVRTRSSPVRTAFAQTSRARGLARRRPAPLKIAAHVPMRGVSPELDEDEDVVMLEAKEKARKDFLEASFAPAPAPVVRGPDVVVRDAQEGLPPRREEKTLKKKTSRPILALFGRK